MITSQIIKWLLSATTLILLLLFNSLTIANAQCTTTTIPIQTTFSGLAAPPLACDVSPTTIPIAASSDPSVPVTVTFSGGTLTSSCIVGSCSFNSYGIKSNPVSLPGCYTNLPPQFTISFSRPVTQAEIDFADYTTVPTIVTNENGVSTSNAGSSLGGTAFIADPKGFQTLTITPTPDSSGIYASFVTFVRSSVSIGSSNPIAGILTANPTSGSIGTLVTVTGSGWANPSGTEYQLLFGGTPLASQTNLSCSTQPNMTFAVPCGINTGTVQIVNQLINSTTKQVIISSQPINFTVTRSTITAEAPTSCDLPPDIKSISRTRGLVGTDVEVVIEGSNFGNKPKVEISGGKPNDIKVNKPISTSNSKIDVIFSISDTAGAPGDSSANFYGVQVCNGKLCSSFIVFFTRIPSALTQQIGVRMVYLGNQITTCNGRVLAAQFYGYARRIIYTVVDQETQPILSPNMTQQEVLIVTDSNPPNQAGSVPGNGLVENDGTFCDTQALGFPTPPAPQPGQFIKYKQSLYITVANNKQYLVRINCIDKEYNDVFITDTTANPNATCR